MRRKPFTPADKLKMQQMAASDFTIDEIAKAVGRTYPAVWYFFYLSGIPVKKQRRERSAQEVFFKKKGRPRLKPGPKPKLKPMPPAMPVMHFEDVHAYD